MVCHNFSFYGAVWCLQNIGVKASRISPMLSYGRVFGCWKGFMGVMYFGWAGKGQCRGTQSGRKFWHISLPTRFVTPTWPIHQNVWKIQEWCCDFSFYRHWSFRNIAVKPYQNSPCYPMGGFSAPGAHKWPIHQNMRPNEWVMCVKFQGPWLNRTREILK